MEIDKKNGLCNYCDKHHAYWVDGNEDDRYISVTTLISQFHEKFDANFWGRYKALEAIVDPTIFSMEKKNLLATHKWDDDILKRYDIDVLTFNTKVNEIIDGYEHEKQIACDRGTKFHLEQEQKFYKQTYHALPQFNLSGEFKCLPNNYELKEEKGIYPEFLVSKITKDGILKLAGQIDLLVKDGNDFLIADYKTNKEIKQKSFYDRAARSTKKMFYPLNNFDDVNYSHYTLQLSTYAWMIEQLNPDYKVKKLVLIHCDHSDKITTYDLNYVKEDVIRMLGYYKKQRGIELEHNKTKQINF
ncbi:MAG: hypothetical protein Nk1A_8890 [Endomicrobiia bacterium]|nr:MAG: hypothetical protein Nk1A_8890 [Endomicrobiia bacterium]